MSSHHPCTIIIIIADPMTECGVCCANSQYLSIQGPRSRGVVDAQLSYDSCCILVDSGLQASESSNVVGRVDFATGS